MVVRALVGGSAFAVLAMVASCASEPAPSTVGTTGTGGQSGGGTGGTVGGGSGGGSGGVTNPPMGSGGQGGGGVSDAAPDVISSSDALPAPSDAAMASEGCGMPPGQALNQAVRKTIMAAGQNREFFVRLPTGYDPMRPYRTIFLGPGCGGKGQNVLPMQNASGPNAIIIGMSPVGNCFDTGGGAGAAGEITFFDEALKFAETSYCVDKARVFVAGFSSGSWWTNMLSCARSGIIRGQGNAAGGQPGSPVPCSTKPIAGLLAHDMGDPENNISGGMRARDRLIALNGCSQQTMPYDWDGNPATASVCVAYQGCKPGFPVVWCPTMGKGHSDQVPLTTTGLWRFWSEF